MLEKNTKGKGYYFFSLILLMFLSILFINTLSSRMYILFLFGVLILGNYLIKKGRRNFFIIAAPFILCLGEYIFIVYSLLTGSGLIDKTSLDMGILQAIFLWLILFLAPLLLVNTFAPIALNSAKFNQIKTRMIFRVLNIIFICFTILIFFVLQIFIIKNAKI